MSKAKLYFESHITIEPVFEDRLERLETVAEFHNFKVAKLLMQKRPEDVPERSRFDTFMTGHSQNFDTLEINMLNLIDDLKSEGFKVWRYKIEDTLLDSRTEDVYKIL